ncbi:hypothetical protein [Ruegeria halocynthiae]|nr:hypothetical protein [Ruegeria halocynthiae]
MTIDQLENTIRREYGGAWFMLFHIVGGEHQFLPTGHKLTDKDYAEIKCRFGAGNGSYLTEEERRINQLRWKADRAEKSA